MHRTTTPDHCTSCDGRGPTCSCARSLSRQLQRAVDLAAAVAGPDLELTGTTRLSGCGRTVAWRARRGLVSLRTVPKTGSWVGPAPIAAAGRGAGRHQ